MSLHINLFFGDVVAVGAGEGLVVRVVTHVSRKTSSPENTFNHEIHKNMSSCNISFPEKIHFLEAHFTKYD